MQSKTEVTEIYSKWMHIFMHQSMRSFIQYTKESGLTMSQVGALFRINQGTPCGINDIGDELGVTSAAASQLVDRLVQQDLVMRNEDPHDRRLKQIALTDKGRQVLKGTIRARQLWMEDLVATMSEPEQAEVGRTFNFLIEKSRQMDPMAEPEPEL